MRKAVDESSELLARSEPRGSHGSPTSPRLPIRNFDTTDTTGTRPTRSSSSRSTANASTKHAAPDENEEDDLETAPAFTAQDELNDIASLSPADIVAVEADLHGLAADFAGLACTSSKEGDTEAANRTSTTSSSASSTGAQDHRRRQPPSPAAALSRLDEEMSNLPSSQTGAYHQAATKCPDLVSDERRVAFLECENYDAKMAAERLARCWETRLELFGPDRCFLPMTLDGAMKDEATNMLQWRIWQPLPVTDTAGRALIYIDPSRRNFAEYSMEQECMVLFYLLEAAVEDPDVRRSGVVYISDGRRMQRYTRKFLHPYQTVLGLVQPIRMRAFHFCCPSRMANYMIEPVVRYAVRRDMRLRFKKHNGSVESVRQTLEGYCLPRDRLPTELGGDVVLDLKTWMLGRWALECSRASPSGAPAAKQPKTGDGPELALEKPKQRGNLSDPRMARALEARLADPDIALYDALIAGGYSFSYNEERNTIFDTDGISLQQRKNNLCRRIRNEKRKRDEENGNDSASSSRCVDNAADKRGGEAPSVPIALPTGTHNSGLYEREVPPSGDYAAAEGVAIAQHSVQHPFPRHGLGATNTSTGSLAGFNADAAVGSGTGGVGMERQDSSFENFLALTEAAARESGLGFESLDDISDVNDVE
mmetsp:Transcript_17200/g.38049  ORF Transcript_17200/g.38049 Transcript_17200/m.38049 type:complete len:651 (-) Transcript_17200:74-2026(-)